MSRRTERIAQQLRSEIARILLEEATDPRIHLVTLTGVDVSPDLSQAIVFFSVLEVEEGPELHRIEVGLASAASFVRRRLAQELPLKRVPALSFRYDPSLARGSRTLSLLRSLSDDPPA